MLNILYQDDDLVAVDKPANLLCVPGLREPDNLFDQLLEIWPNLRVVHRLDMATSGVMVFALNHASQKALGHQFERRQVDKAYTAWVHGLVEADCGDIAAPMLCDWPNRPKQKVDWLQGRAAHTQFFVLNRTDNKTLLRLKPLTGRSHQLRVHCQWLGHPIIGDYFYAPEPTDARLMLHAHQLGLQHPRTQQRLELRCPAPF